MPTTEAPVIDAARYQALIAKVASVRQEVGKVIVGQSEVIDQVLMAIFSGGHCLMEGVPGLAKTLLVSTLSQVLHLTFKRVQFTPDLMPGDITGGDIIQEQPDGSRKFEFIEGPLFANMILADEINRTPPRTQAALLEAMQEHRITVGRSTYRLPEPFFVLATQNPIEQEGTYTLPEAQQDRFMFFIHVDYPQQAEEVEVVKRTTRNASVSLQALLSGPEILEAQRIVREIPVADALVEYAVEVVRASRAPGVRGGGAASGGVPEAVRKYGQWGAGPRASQYLIMGAKARAFLLGKTSVAREDIDAVALPVLRHRVIVNFAAQAEGVNSSKVIEDILAHVRKG